MRRRRNRRRSTRRRRRRRRLRIRRRRRRKRRRRKTRRRRRRKEKKNTVMIITTEHHHRLGGGGLWRTTITTTKTTTTTNNNKKSVNFHCLYISVICTQMTTVQPTTGYQLLTTTGCFCHLLIIVYDPSAPFWHFCPTVSTFQVANLQYTGQPKLFVHSHCVLPSHATYQPTLTDLYRLCNMICSDKML